MDTQSVTLKSPSESTCLTVVRQWRRSDMRAQNDACPSLINLSTASTSSAARACSQRYSNLSSTVSKYLPQQNSSHGQRSTSSITSNMYSFQLHRLLVNSSFSFCRDKQTHSHLWHNETASSQILTLFIHNFRVKLNQSISSSNYWWQKMAVNWRQQRRWRRRWQLQVKWHAKQM